jgi:hypothetical protein
MVDLVATSRRAIRLARVVMLAVPLAVACGGGAGVTSDDVADGTAPVITTAPSARVVPVGASWTFAVGATGSRLTYQWRRNGQAIEGATAATFSFTPRTMQDGGSLDVVVRNGVGSTTSAPVNVRVVSTAGPWQQDLKIAVGSDPNRFGAPTTFVAQAGVVSVTRRPTGQLVAVFQWFPFADPAAFDLVATSLSNDGGRTWSSPRTLSVVGLPANYQRPFDPTITVREDGSLRLYFTCGSTPAVGATTGLGFCSATSTDGFNYVVEPGQRFYPGRSTVDCAVLRWNGQWHLTSPIGAPQEGAYHAVSTDGLTFTRVADIPSSPTANWTGNLVAVGSAMRFYGSPLWYASTTDGVAWTAPISLGVGGGDPAVVEAETGRWLVIYTGAPGS